MTSEPVVVFDPATSATFEAPERPLKENEAVIRNGLGTFAEVGRALLDIRNSGQYREAGFDTFDAYCKTRWGFGKSWASEHIAGVRVVDALSVRDSEQLPANLAQTRPLVPLLSEGEEVVQEAWAEIVEAHQGDGAITARQIRAHLNPAATSAPSQRPVSDAYLAVLDKLDSTLKCLQWAVKTHQGAAVPEPVAKRFAEYALAAGTIAEAVEAIGNGKPPESVKAEP